MAASQALLRNPQAPPESTVRRYPIAASTNSDNASNRILRNAVRRTRSVMDIDTSVILADGCHRARHGYGAGMATMPARAPLPPGTGHVSIWVGRPDGTTYWALDEHRPHDAASTWKLLVLIAWLQAVGAASADPAALVRVHPDFPSATGTQTFTVSRVEDDDRAVWEREEARLEWLVERMVTRSSNLATDLVVEQVGLQAVADVAAGFSGLEIRRLIDDSPAIGDGIRNTVTAFGLAQVLAALVGGRLLPAAATERALGLLRGNTWNDEIPARLPAHASVAHKNGWDLGIRHDAGIVTSAGVDPLIVSVLTTGLTDDVAQRYIAAVARWGWDTHTSTSA